jgi:sigma-B regulation protein RsbU (phosphoserine phosphatase)
VGGDFFDFFLIDPDHLGFLIADVSGKGVPSALFMAAARTLLRATALQGASSAECVQYVNNVLARQGDGTMFVTLVYGILDTRTGQVDYCNAGHHRPYVFSAHGGLRKASDGGGMMAGLYEIAKYECGSLRLEPGDGVLLYTDGVTEAFNAADEMFGESGLLSALEAGAHASVDQIVKGLMREVKAFVGSAPQSDDVTVLAFRYFGS